MRASLVDLAITVAWKTNGERALVLAASVFVETDQVNDADIPEWWVQARRCEYGKDSRWRSR